MSAAFSVAVISTSAGCATGENLAALREMPSFHVGYNDGCLTANEEDKSFSTKTARDKEAFETDEAYRAGWRQGYLECNTGTPDAIDGGRILGERNEY
jgi:hypothetical protein